MEFSTKMSTENTHMLPFAPGVMNVLNGRHTMNSLCSIPGSFFFFSIFLFVGEEFFFDKGCQGEAMPVWKGHKTTV
jgi:hypothetical protein